MRTPCFWSRRLGLAALLLAPLSWLYDLAVRLRWKFTKPERVERPVICVGDFTLGGAGKTPAVIFIAERLKRWGERPFILSRGYGGSLHGPHIVDPDKDRPQDVGDEPLLLARVAPTIIGADRVLSAQMAIEHHASVLIMDDGMQNPHLQKTLTLALADEQNGFGNARVFPAGPLRAALSWQEKRIDAVIVIKSGNAARHASLDRLQFPYRFPASLQTQDAEWLADRGVLAFCGIGKPEKFRATLQKLGARIFHFEIFPDHHIYTALDARRLIALATKENLTLVTTEKDRVRLQGLDATRGQLTGLTNSVAVKFAPDDNEAFDALLKRTLRFPGSA